MEHVSVKPNEKRKKLSLLQMQRGEVIKCRQIWQGSRKCKDVPFVLILFLSVLILFPFAHCHVCWCMQTCNVYMDSTIIFYFLFCKHAIFNQGDKSQAFLFSLAPFLFSLVRWTAWEVGSIAWGGRRTNQRNCRTQTISTLYYF